MNDEAALTVVPPAELVIVPEAADTRFLKGAEWIGTLDTLNWRDLKPHQLALVLASRRFPVEDGGYQRLSPTDALTIAYSAYQMGLNPFSTEMWIDLKKMTVNPTTEGLERIARDRHIAYEIGEYAELTRPWPARLPKLAGIVEDAGIRCTLHISGKERPVSYTAWLSEWGVRWDRDRGTRQLYGAKWMSPQWEERTTHMLRKRAYNHALEDLLGVGGSAAFSEMPINPLPAIKE